MTEVTELFQFRPDNCKTMAPGSIKFEISQQNKTIQRINLRECKNFCLIS